jgi:demethylmenaquinone methyltransferase / 2-methoxy-6-polyprenyl-1,4-benzoquinol methylase
MTHQGQNRAANEDRMTERPEPNVHARAGTAHDTAVMHMFNRIAPTYDRLNGMLSVGVDRIWRKHALLALAVDVDQDVLDLCAGTLDVSAQIARDVPSARVIAADFSREMLERGRHKAPRVQIQVADAMALPFEDASFDRVVCSFGIRNVADTEQALEEAFRVLRPGGKMVTLEFFRPVRLDAKVFHRAYASLVLPTVGRLVSRDPGAYRYLKESMAGFLTRQEYEQMTARVGFTGVRGSDELLGIASIIVAHKAEAQ